MLLQVCDECGANDWQLVASRLGDVSPEDCEAQWRPGRHSNESISEFEVFGVDALSKIFEELLGMGGIGRTMMDSYTVLHILFHIVVLPSSQNVSGILNRGAKLQQLGSTKALEGR